MLCNKVWVGLCCRELNSMDADLYEAGKQLLLTRRNGLRTAGQLQHLLQLKQNVSKPHQRQLPQNTSDSQGEPNTFGQ